MVYFNMSENCHVFHIAVTIVYSYWIIWPAITVRAIGHTPKHISVDI